MWNRHYRTRIFSSLGSCVIAASALLAGCGSPFGSGGGQQAAAQCEAYPEKDIELVVPVSAGGGFDAWARMIAPFLARYLPNDVNVVVRNLPGAGTMRGTRQVYSAEPDGYTLLFTKFGPTATNHLLGKTSFGLGDFTWIGQVTVDPIVFFVDSGADVQTISDVKRMAKQADPVLHAARERSATTAIVYQAYGIDNYSTVLHEGSSEAVVSLIRGDTDVTWLSLGSTIEYLKDGSVKPILYIGDRKPQSNDPAHGLVGAVPTTAETGHSELGSGLAMPRAVAAPPDTPHCIRNILEKALLDTLKNPKFKKQANNANRVVIPAGAKETAKFAQRKVKLYEKYERSIRQELTG